ncbi:MAG: MGMT family protein [Candidatus Dormiibacterota bacterium]
MSNRAGRSLAEAVARVLGDTVPGEVLTYGEVAAMAGYLGAARAVGRVLAKSEGLPWWRVVTSQGRLVPGHEVRQAQLLSDEGVAIDQSRCRIARTGPGNPD